MMLRTRGWIGVLSGLAIVLACTVSRVNSAEVTKVEYDQLKKDVEELRKKLASTTSAAGATTAVDQALENKYGPNAKVTTRQGKLTLGGLVQVWFYTIQNDNLSWVDANQVAGGPPALTGSNEVVDNDSFRVRRAQLRFTMDIHENVTAYVMIDPAAEATSFPTFGSNLGNTTTGASVVNFNSGFTSVPGVAVENGNERNAAVRSGGGAANRMLHDAYINYHGVIPHHDFTVGQMQRPLGEEGIRDDATLDFVERAMITQLAYSRDIGVMVHGTWWDDRCQYWIGAFNGSGTAFQSHANRSDTNDEKDLVWRILVRPLWKDELWGSIELGYSMMYGVGGEGGSRFTGTAPVDGLNRAPTVHMMQNAWASYLPGGPVRGWWLRGEWGLYRDRFAPAEVATGDAATSGPVDDPAPFNIQGWSFSTGYKLMDSRWADGLNSWVKPMEFTFRYEVMQNLFYHDLENPSRELDVFKTQIYTAGINYYIKGHNAKLQLNYNVVVEDDDSDLNERQMREVRNNNFVVNFQVAW